MGYLKHLYPGNLKKVLLLSTLPVISALLNGCALPPNHQERIDHYTQRLQARAEVVTGTIYQHQSIQVMSGKSQKLRVYIEGDGRAWAKRNRPSMDPTPSKPMALELMAADTVIDKAYIARPCQYIKNANCKISTWTDQRYSKESLDSLNAVLDKLKTRGRYSQLELVGFSGGATLALLAAAGRRDVVSVRTVAGNLDPTFVNKLHKVSPMPEALRPIHFTRELKNIPQLHLFGANDSVIPPSVFAAYKDWFDTQKCLEGVTINEADHQSGWIKQWQTILNIPLPKC